MPLQRRELLRLAGAAAMTTPTWRMADAQDYPTRPVRIIEGLGGGSTPNLVSRLIGQWLSEHLGQPFVVESRTGAGGNIAAQAVVSAAPDGYTLLTIVTTNAINVTLYDKLDFDFLHDIVPIAGVFRLPMVLLVNSSFPAATLLDFIAYAKANPGKVNIASPGIGTPMHVGIEREAASRHRSRSCGLSRPSGRMAGFVLRTGPSLHHHGLYCDRLHPGGQGAPIGGDRRKTH
jgi:tripartite-type tricarboxylate transporter receptor subunit TctC